MKLNQDISDLIRTGHFIKANRIIKNELSVSELSISRTIEFKILKAQISFKKGLYVKTISKIEHILELCGQIKEVLWVFKCHLIIANSTTRIGDFEKATYHLSEMESSMEIIRENYSNYHKAFLSDILFIKALIARYQSHFDLAIKFYQECIELKLEIRDFYGTAEPRNHLGIIYDHLGDYDTALRQYQLAFDLFNEFDDEIALLGVMSNLGVVHWQEGNLEKSRKIFLSALKKASENPNYERIGPMIINIGLVSIDLGRLNEAKGHFKKALIYFEEIEDKRGILLCFMNLGIIHDLLWEFDSAIINYYHAVELAEQTGNKDELLKLFINIGITHKNQNKLELALQYFNKAHSLNTGLQSTLGQSKILYLLATTYLRLNQIVEAENLQVRLDNLTAATNNVVVDRTRRLLDGIILKSKSGLTNRARALKIFSALIREESISYEIAMSAIVNLCEILVTEVQITKNEGDLNEIEFLLNKMELLSGENPSSIVKINILLMKSRIAFMFEKIDEAVGLLEKATNIAEIQNIKYLTNRVHDERNYLESQALSMQQVGGMASMKLDLINKRNDDYIDFLKKNFKNVIHSK